MIIEYASFDTQAVIGSGVVNYENGSGNEAAQTGSTKGNRSGYATSTLRIQSDGTENTGTTGGYRSIYYRGFENFYGNIWKHVNGINVWGDGTMNGGQVYICSNFVYDESKHDDNYVATGLYFANATNCVKYFGYNATYDWLFIPSKTATSAFSLMKDYCYLAPNLRGYRVARVGGRWSGSSDAGAFLWAASSVVDYRDRYLGGRLLHVLTVGATRGLQKSTKITQIFEEAKGEPEEMLEKENPDEMR